MKLVNITFRGTSMYQQLCEFSSRRYLEDLKLKISNYPDIFVYATSKKGIEGCMGLNQRIRSPLFKEDLSLLRNLSADDVNCGEQSVFVVERRSPTCVPFLIAVTAMYGHYLGMTHIVYAGIDVSCRTIEKLGFDTKKIGKTSIDCLDERTRENYRNWHDAHDPVTYLLNTGKASAILNKLVERFQNKIVCSYDFKPHETPRRKRV